MGDSRGEWIGRAAAAAEAIAVAAISTAFHYRLPRAAGPDQRLNR